MGQHFVPRFYLRRFCSNSGLLQCYDVRKERFFADVSVSSQCQESNMYGKLEQTLGKLESAAAPVIERLLSSRAFPAAGSDDLTMLAAFVAFQRLRTRASARYADEQLDAFYRELFRREFGLDSSGYKPAFPV